MKEKKDSPLATRSVNAQRCYLRCLRLPGTINNVLGLIVCPSK